MNNQGNPFQSSGAAQSSTIRRSSNFTKPPKKTGRRNAPTQQDLLSASNASDYANIEEMKQIGGGSLRQNLFHGTGLYSEAVQDPMAPSYETSTLVKYTSSQRDPQPMFGRESNLTDGLTAGQDESSPMRSYQQEGILVHPPQPSPQDANEREEPIISTQQQQYQQPRVVPNKKPVLVHLSSRQGRSSREQGHVTGVSNTKVKKLLIKAESLKIVTTDSKFRFQNSQSSQLLSLVKTNTNPPEHKKSLKIAMKPRNIAFNKIKSQASVAMNLEQLPTREKLQQQSVDQVYPSFHAEAPLQEAHPQTFAGSQEDALNEQSSLVNTYQGREESKMELPRQISLQDFDQSHSNVTSGAKASKQTNNKDSSNFNDIEEKVQHELAQNEDSGWFTTHPDGVQLLIQTPAKRVDSQDGHDQLYVARGLTSSTELKTIQRPMHMINLEEAPLIKRVPDSGISHKSRKQLIAGENSNLASQPSERFSEMTDDLQSGANNLLMLASLESLRSNESNSSLKNVFSQSQKLTDIATRYINIQDDNTIELLDSDSGYGPKSRRAVAIDEKGTPRFSRQIKGGKQNKQKISLRKKKSHEGQRESFNQKSKYTIHRHLIAPSDQKLKSGIRNLKTPDDQLSANQDENSISSLTQQKDMKSLMGILKKHEQKSNGQQRTLKSNNSQLQHQRQSTKIQLSKLSDNLYPVSQTGHYQATQPHPLTPNSTGNAALTMTGFGSGNSQQSRSFNVGMSGLQSQQSKKKLQTAKQSAITQWKQQNGLIKNTFQRVLQQKTQQHAFKAAQATQEGSASKQKSSGNGAQSHREKNSFQILLPQPNTSANPSNKPKDLKIATDQRFTDTTALAYVKDELKASQMSNKAANSQKLKQKQDKGDSQRQRLFQKQLSQTIKLNSLSSGISPKASGDMPVEFTEHRGSIGRGKFSKQTTKAIKIPTNQTTKLASGLSSLIQTQKQESSEVYTGEDSAFVERRSQRMKIGQPSTIIASNRSPSQHRVRDPSPRVIPKQLIDEEGIGPLPSVNKLNKIESLKLAIRQEKAQKNVHQHDGQPYQGYQSRPFPAEESATVDEDDEDADEDNISEMMQTILQSTQKSTHPVAHFNESHPTQQIQGMMKKPLRQANVLQNNSPGDRLENAYQVSQQHMRSRQIVQLTQNSSSDYSITEIGDLKKRGYRIQASRVALESQNTYQMKGPPSAIELLPNNLLKSESIQSMSNVIDKDPPPPINKIQRVDGAPFINNSVQLRNSKLKFLQKQSRNAVSRTGAINSRQPIISEQSAYQFVNLRRNIFVAMLEDGILSIVMKYLPIRRVLPLKSLLQTKVLLKREGLHVLLEREFLRYIDSYRCNDPSIGGKRSMLCRLITMYFLSTLEVTQHQDDVFSRINYKLRLGRTNVRASTETGTPFEIEKDVDRTFLDKAKFTEQHRHGLSIVLRSIAELQKDVGYVQGLNFIVGNLLIMMEHREPMQAQKAALAAFFTWMQQLDIKEFYTEKMLGLKEAIFKLECLLYNEMPEVFLFLMEQNISVEYFASQWFLTMFQYDIEDVEQSAIIMLMAMVFGQKVIFQIAFQLVHTISSKLCCMSFEQALIYLKDFAGEPQYRTTTFLLDAMKNDRITNELLSELGRIYNKMSVKQPNKSTYSDQPLMATRVKFLRGTKPGKVKIKVISSTEDLLSNSNSLASMSQFHVVKPVLLEQQSDDSAPIVIEDVPEMINSNRQNNLSQKMTGIINQSIERKKKQMGTSVTSSQQFQQQVQRTFLQPSKTVLEDLTHGTITRHKHPNAFPQPSPILKKDHILLHSVSIDNSIELMEPTAPNEEAVASEDVDADDSNSRHFFGNKELFEHTQNKNQDSNLHRYQMLQTAAEEGTVNSQKLSPTRARGISYNRYNQPSQQDTKSNMMGEHLASNMPYRIAESTQLSRVAIVNQRPAQRSPTEAPSSEDEQNGSSMFAQIGKLDDTPRDTEPDFHGPDKTPKMKQLNSPAIKKIYGNRIDGGKGVSLSPNKQQIDATSGFSNFFLKLNPFAIQQAQRQQNSIDHSSEESARHDESLAFGDTQEQVSRPNTYRAPPQRDPPLFMSPQSVYRRYQNNQHEQNLQMRKSQDRLSANQMSQDFARSPRAFQPSIKQPNSGRHRKTTTVTGGFNSRQMHYPEALQNSNKKDGSSAKKPSSRQKQKFAEILNLEKLNLSQQQSKVSSGRVSKVVRKTSNSRPGSSMTTSQVYLQASENIPESEQKEQKVNNISLYGSTNPKNLKMTKKRQDFQQGVPSKNDESVPQTPLLDQIKPQSLVEWDEDDMIIRSDKLPTIPVTKQSGLLSRKQQKQTSSKQIMKERMINQFKMTQKKVIMPSEDRKAEGPVLKHHSSQEDLRTVRSRQNQGGTQRFQQELLQSKDKKLMGQLNQSLEETKTTSQVRTNQANESYQSGKHVLKESRSHDRDTMLSRLTASGMRGINQQRLFNVMMDQTVENSRSQTSQDVRDQENLQDLEEDNFANGKIPQANISSYNSHQSNKKHGFQAKFGQVGYASSGSNVLEDTCVISNRDNVMFRDELRKSKLMTYQEQESSDKDDSPQPLFTQQRAGVTRQQQFYGKQSVQRQSLQVQGHKGDRLHEDQAL